jgi:hypothetical protein
MDAKLSGFLMVSSCRLGNGGLMDEAGLAENLGSLFVFACRAPGVCGGLPIALDLVETGEGAVVTSLLDGSSRYRQGGV